MKTIDVTVLTSDCSTDNNQTSPSYFTHKNYSIDDYNGLFITERIESQNFRHRMSEPGYFSSWHVAGDPTLIIIRAGTLRLGLRNGEFRDFSAGDMFIAQDHLHKDEVFNNELHGHTAELIGKRPLLAVHLKLTQKA